MYGSNITDSYGKIYIINKNFNFRSPYLYDGLDFDDSAVYVYPGGDVDSSYSRVTHSYGWKYFVTLRSSTTAVRLLQIPTGANSPNISSYGSSSFDVLDSGEVMGGELVPESYGIFYFL